MTKPFDFANDPSLPPLKPTDVVAGREARVHRMPPGPERSKERSRTYAGIAQAMARQCAPSEVLI